MDHETEVTKSNWDHFFAIAASGVVFGSGGAMIGAAVAGPVGGLVGGALGVASGAAVEIMSQRRHDKERAR